MSQNRGLGRGLDSLIPTHIDRPDSTHTGSANVAAGSTLSQDSVLQLDPSKIEANPHQPRKTFDASELSELASSIKSHGILQPLVVSKSKSGVYELLAGERRLRAAKQAGLKTVPAIVRSFDELQKLELAIIENIQRSQLNAIETAQAYRALIDDFGLDLDAVSKRVGKAKPTVSNMLRLLGLPKEARDAIASGKISEGHGRAILGLGDPAQQANLLNQILTNNLSVRQAEELARNSKLQVPVPVSGESSKSLPVTANPLAGDISASLKTKVTIQPKAKGGRLIIEYKDEGELNRIAEIIKNN
jgi:ParB family transcriptional regulator, chromosome partitioning protein